MGIYVLNKCWKFRLKFPIRLRENLIFAVVHFLAAPCIHRVLEKKDQHYFVHNFYKLEGFVLFLASNILEVLQNYFM